MEPKKKPLYQPWNEEAFIADERVQAMNPIQRWMYRTLLQKAFFGSERPYLPADDKRLWMLAGCSSRAEWEENRDLVLEAFTPVRIDGVDLLMQKRLVSDWERITEKREEMADLGRKSAKRMSDLRAAKAQPTTDAGSTDVQRTLDARSTDAEPTFSEVKRSEEKLREVKKERETEDPSVCLSQSDTEPQGTPTRQVGDPGYWEDGQYSWATNTKKVFGVMKEKWQNIVGRGYAVEMPFKGWRDSFVQMLNASDADTIVPAFELWAFERGKYNPTTQPIIAFMKDGWQKWTERVGPLNQFAAQDVVITDEMRAQWVAEANQNCAANLDWYLTKLREAEEDYEANSNLFDEATQQQMRDDIERYKAKVAELTAENA